MWELTVQSGHRRVKTGKTLCLRHAMRSKPRPVAKNSSVEGSGAVAVRDTASISLPYEMPPLFPVPLTFNPSKLKT